MWPQLVRWTVSIKSLLYPILIFFNSRKNRKFTLPDLLSVFFFTGNIPTPVLIPHPWGHKIEFFFLHPKDDFLPFSRGKMSDFAVLMFYLVHVRNPGSQDLNHKGHFKIRCSLLYMTENFTLTSNLNSKVHLVCTIWLHKNKAGIHICLKKKKTKKSNPKESYISPFLLWK